MQQIVAHTARRTSFVSV